MQTDKYVRMYIEELNIPNVVKEFELPIKKSRKILKKISELK
jgi:hypothetical protein